jgi:antitoxin ParD1/3/4
MNVSLTPELERFVTQKVESGLYATGSAVICEALRLLQERERSIEELRKQIGLGIEQADRGEVAPLDMEAILAKSREQLLQNQELSHAPGSSHQSARARL